MKRISVPVFYHTQNEGDLLYFIFHLSHLYKIVGHVSKE